MNAELIKAAIEEQKKMDRVGAPMSSDAEENIAASVLNRIEKSGGLSRISGLPPATIEARTVANALFPGDDNARRSYLISKGFNPSERGWFYDAPPGERMRELTADVSETMLPAIVKGGGQYIGEAGGAILGAKAGAVAGAPVAGVGALPGAAIGAKAASVAGGGIGRMMAQDMIENYAASRGLGAPGAGERAANEAALGALTSTVGIAAPNVPFAAKKLAQDIGKTKFGGFIAGLPEMAKKHVLTQLSKIPEPMQEFIAKIPGGWKAISQAASGAYAKVADYAQSRVVPAVANYKKTLGQRWEQMAGPVIDNPNNVIDFSAIRGDAIDTIRNFARRMSPEERNDIVSVLRGFVKPQVNPASRAVQSGRLLPIGPMTLREVYEQLNNVDRLLLNKYAGTDEAIKQSGAFIGALKALRSTIKDHIHSQFKQLKGADEVFDKGMDTVFYAVENFGDAQKAINFIPKLFQKVSKNELGVRAFDAIDEASPDELKYGNVMRFYGTAEHLNVGRVEPSGFQYGLLPRLAGGTVGGLIGAATAPEDRKLYGFGQGALVGAGLVSAAQTPFLSPRSAGKTMAMLEGLKAPQLPGWARSAAGAIAGQLPKVIQDRPEVFKEKKVTPRDAAAKDLEEKFGIGNGLRINAMQ